MFHGNRDARLRDLLDDPMTQALMKADRVDTLKVEAMLLRIADELKSRDDVSAADCGLNRVLGFFKTH